MQVKFILANYDKLRGFIENTSELELRQVQKMQDTMLNLETQHTPQWDSNVNIDVRRAQICNMASSLRREVLSQKNAVMELVNSVETTITSAEQQAAQLLADLILEKLNSTVEFEDMTSKPGMTLNDLKDKDIELYYAVDKGGKSLGWAELAYEMKQGNKSVEEIKALAEKYGISEEDMYYSLDEYAQAKELGLTVEEYREQYEPVNTNDSGAKTGTSDISLVRTKDGRIVVANKEALVEQDEWFNPEKVYDTTAPKFEIDPNNGSHKYSDGVLSEQELALIALVCYHEQNNEPTHVAAVASAIMNSWERHPDWTLGKCIAYSCSPWAKVGDPLFEAGYRNHGEKNTVTNQWECSGVEPSHSSGSLIDGTYDVTTWPDYANISDETFAVVNTIVDGLRTTTGDTWSLEGGKTRVKTYKG